MSLDDLSKVVAKLERLKWGDDKYIKLVPRRGSSISIAKEDIIECKFFENLLNENPMMKKYRTIVNRETLKYLKEYIQFHGTYPLQSSFQAILFSSQIQWSDFSRHCIFHAKSLEVPRSAKVKDICTVAQAVVRRVPLRTAEHYTALVDLMSARLSKKKKHILVDSVLKALAEKSSTMFQPFPIPVLSRKVTIALMEDELHRPIVAILRDDPASHPMWTEFDVFGPNFDPFKEEAKGVHLVYDQYVVYHISNGEVLIQDLHSTGPPTTLLTGCKFFRSRRTELHVICENDLNRSDCLYEWSSLEKRFVEKFSRPRCLLKTAHRRNDTQNNLVVVLESGRVIELMKTREFMKGETCLDSVDDCKRRTGEAFYLHKGRLKNGMLDRLELQTPVHIGFERLSTVSCGEDLFKTVVWERVKGEWRIVGYTQPHGAVLAMSDISLW